MKYIGHYFRRMDENIFDALQYKISVPQIDNLLIDTTISPTLDNTDKDTIALKLKDIAEFTDIYTFTIEVETKEPYDWQLIIQKQDFSYQLMDYLKENNIKFSFNQMASTVDDLAEILDQGPQIIKITSPLAFSIADIHRQHPEAKFRIVPDVSQGYPNDATSFFVRPEGLKYYKPFIDSVEFGCPLKQQSLVCQIYKSGQFRPTLYPLIRGLNSEISGNTLKFQPIFDMARLNCGKKCKLARNCEVCPHQEILAEMIINFKENEENT